MQGKMQAEIIFVLTTLLVFIPISSSLENYKFHKGTNASITFNLKQSNNSMTFEFFTLNSEIPFYVHEAIDHRALYPDQRGRFAVAPRNSGQNFTVTLSIQDIKEIDSGVYVLCAREVQNGKTTDYIHDAYVEVIIPPGKAECTVKVTNYSLEVIYCQANIGSDGKDLIGCYQNLREAPAIGKIIQTAAKIKAAFWISTSLPVACCSMMSDFKKETESCNDFVFPSEVHITKIEKEVESSYQHGSTVPTVPVTDQETQTHSWTDKPTSTYHFGNYLYPAFGITVTSLLALCLSSSIVSNVLLVKFCTKQRERYLSNHRYVIVKEETPMTDSLCTTSTH